MVRSSWWWCLWYILLVDQRNGIAGLDADAYGADHIGWMILNEVLVLNLSFAQGEHGWIDTSWHIQRGSSFRDFSRYSGGVSIAEGIPRKRISWSALCPWCQRGRVTWCGGCHQVQRGRLLALCFKCCPWWQLTQRLVQVLRGWYRWWQLNQRTDLSTAGQERDIRRFIKENPRIHAGLLQ